MRKIRTNLLTPLDADHFQFLPDHVLTWDKAGISALRPYDPSIDRDSEDRLDCLVLPGLIDVHVHLSQYRIRGRYEPSLLSWLERHVFPEEARSADADYAGNLAREFFQALFAAGTTCSVIYTAPYVQACETAFATARELGARAFIGMTLMDRNSPSNLVQTTDYAYSRSVELYQRYHQASPLLDYIFTPRFALSCSEDLMRKIGSFANARGAWIQTHLAENSTEVKQVAQLFGVPYTQAYEQLGMLTHHTILAHAIHLAESDMDTLAEHGCRIAHCPDSNFFLKSGEFPYQSLAERKISIGIGSDVAAGTTLSMLYHAKIANFRQSEYSLTPERLLYHITLGNARLLGWDRRIGSLEAGKDADLCILRMPAHPVPAADLLSALCFQGHEWPVAETVIAGRTVYQA